MSIRHIMGLVNTTLPFAWDDSLSVYEMLGKLISKINEVVDEVNLKLPDDFEKAFYAKFREYTREEMQRIIDSGEFATILDSMIVEFLPIKSEIIEARDGESSLIANLNKMKGDLNNSVNNLKEFKDRRNPDSALTTLFNVALTYANRGDLTYSNIGTMYHKTTTNGIDCSTFIQASLEMTPYQNTRYASGVTKNVKGSTGLYFPSEFKKAEGNVRLLANNLAEYAKDQGWLYQVNSDYTNVMPGDLLFSQNNPQPHNYLEIGHVAFVLRKDQVGVSDNDYFITLLDCSSGRTVPVRETIRLNPEALITGSKMTYGARFPIPDSGCGARVINTNGATPVTTTLETTNSISTIQTNKDLEPLKMYTLIAKLEFSGSVGVTYPLIKNGSSTIYSFTSFVKKRPDGLYIVQFFMPQVESGFERELVLKGVGDTYTSATVNWVQLYDGFVSDWNGTVE